MRGVRRAHACRRARARPLPAGEAPASASGGSGRGGGDGRVLDVDGRHIGWLDALEADRPAGVVVPAPPGWWVVVADEDGEGVPDGPERLPVVAWRIGARGRALPVTLSRETDRDIDPTHWVGVPYVLLSPDGGARDCQGTALEGSDDAALLAHPRKLHRRRARIADVIAGGRAASGG